ncbi:hypothetical protein [Hyphomicrobium methylovorum]|uniref:hypothetical protein n=1 Tax=Hyphomicrobium methylovorum TaxID=84 RepID=UPI0015E7481C|nr:hypothetical protein [Hyphomicrobium methylovorum]
MSEFTLLILVGASCVMLFGYLANVFAFLSADRFPILRLLDGKPVVAKMIS